MKRRALVAAGTGLVLWPAIAWADKTITAEPQNRYGTPDVTMDQGEKLTFRNNDVAGHDVTATGKGPDGKPLFSTPIIGRGESAFVEGSQYLTTGHYPFICSVHPNMKGSVHVTGNGTPQQRPGSGGGGGGGGPAPKPDDKQAPALAVQIVSRRMRAVRRARSLRVRLSLDEAARVSLRAVARPKVNGRLVTVARGSVNVTGEGVRRVSVRLTRAGRRAMRKKRLAVIVTARARDGAGNRTTEQHGRTLGLKTKTRR
jgi:plastocyanin